jgi:hypothetical protein
MVFAARRDNQLDCDLLVVDEASMVDVMLMHALMKAVPDDAALLISCRRSDQDRCWPTSSPPAPFPSCG